MKKVFLYLVILSALKTLGLNAAITQTESRREFSGSIHSVMAASSSEHGQKGHRPALVSTALSSAQLSTAMEFEIALKMHNLPELQERVAKNEKITPTEMAAKYWPSKEEHKLVLDWVKAQGFEVVRTDYNHLAVFAKGKVSNVQTALKTQFARVAYNDSEYTSAVVAPSLPTSLANVVVGIHGLQPHIRMTPRHILMPQASGTNAPPYLPAQVATAYNANGLNYNGTGQIIGIISNAYPSSSDLNKFWTAAGLTIPASNIVQVNVNGGPAVPADPNSLAEASLDVEWSSALAPGATIMVYGSNINDPAGFDKTYQQVYNDALTHPGFSQFSMSFGENETVVESDYLVIESQYMANLASTGMTVLAASGDGGSNPDPSTGSYSTTAPLDVSYPASDPCVTGVGGTRLVLTSAGTVSSETTWVDSGGGYSHYYKRPTWQTALGITAGTYRLSPDVAAIGDPQTGAVVYINGVSQTIGGTSLATPVWAAFCALINQARSANKLSSLGFLNPRLYPLANSIAFRDITLGNNGNYYAGTGYDLCTGIGSPNVANLIQATFIEANQAPQITTAVTNRFTTLGQSASFAVSVVSPTPLSYQWQRQAAGTNTWSNLTNSSTYSGVTSNILMVSSTTLAMSGDQFRCVTSNTNGSTTSSALSLTVSTTGMSTLAGWPSAAGFLDGTGSSARFDSDGGIRLDSAGNIYVADSVNNAIRKVTPTGVVTTLLGSSGNAGSTDGALATASINGPGGVAVDSSGNVYIADSLNYTIRKITPSGTVSTLAGSAGLKGKTDGVGTAARFEDPENLAVDASGNVWVADGQGCTVRQITPNGTVTTIAGKALSSGSTDGIGTSARFGTILGIAVDPAGNVFVSDSSNATIRKITLNGSTANVTTIAGSAGSTGTVDGTGSAARFNMPSGLAVDAQDTIYVCDSNNDTIRKITSQGVVTTIAGSPGVADSSDGIGSAGHLNSPGDIALDQSGNLYVADFFNNTVRKIIPTTSPIILSTTLNQSLLLGSTTTLSVNATGIAPLTYQWYLNGVLIPSATSSSYLISNFQASNAGTYTVNVTSPTGVTTTTAAILSVQNPRLLNLSARATVNGTTAALTAGFVISGTGTKNLLLRGIGPALSNYGITTALSKPQLTFYNSSAQIIATNSGWNNSLTYGSQSFQTLASQASASTMSSVGAFALTQGSADSAVLASLPLTQGNAYTVQVSGMNSTNGVALDEIYDMDSTNASSRLINISAGAVTSGGANTLTAGFVVGGTGTEKVLIRADGPALIPYGVAGTLAQPVLTIYDAAGNTIASSTGWSNAPVIGNSAVLSSVTQATSSIMASVGAFSLGANSGDSALVVSVPPGNYTAQVTGLNGSTGYALIEIYEVSQ